MDGDNTLVDKAKEHTRNGYYPQRDVDDTEIIRFISNRGIAGCHCNVFRYQALLDGARLQRTCFDAGLKFDVGAYTCLVS